MIREGSLQGGTGEWESGGVRAARRQVAEPGRRGYLGKGVIVDGRKEGGLYLAGNEEGSLDGCRWGLSGAVYDPPGLVRRCVVPFSRGFGEARLARGAMVARQLSLALSRSLARGALGAWLLVVDARLL